MNPSPEKNDSWSPLFSRRILGAKTSFVREILKVTENPEIISFAGGLPSPELFPVEAISEAAAAVLREQGRSALQYSTSEGYLPLREWIAARYFRRFGLTISPDQILITTGSQQALDLLGKVFINPGDRLFIERPGYLGAIQSFSLFEPQFVGIDSTKEGINPLHLAQSIKEKEGKLLYTVPNFQNPSGTSFSEAVRKAISLLADNSSFALIEDDPYGELRYQGHELASLRNYTDKAILLGSFSKIVAPGLRVGWVCAPQKVIRRLVVAKQAADLHSDVFAQRILSRFFKDADFESHLGAIRTAYGSRCATMIKAFRSYMPAGASCNDPDGGMFLWAKLPQGVSTMALFNKAIAQKVAFVPGSAFYCDEGGDNAMRLNFTNTPEPRIEEGIKRLANAIDGHLNHSS
jgi:2-aminoadipate transaminase